MKHDETEMRYFAAELQKMLDEECIEDCKCEVEPFLDGGVTPAIKVKPSPLNTDQQTIFCLPDIVRFSSELDLSVYASVEDDGETTIPIVVIF